MTMSVVMTQMYVLQKRYVVRTDMDERITVVGGIENDFRCVVASESISRVEH